MSRSGSLLFGLAAGAGMVALTRRRSISLRGRVALVTGGSRGLGFLIARELLREGCDVAICARDPVVLEQARARLSAGGRILAVRCDVGDADQVAAMITTVTGALGPIDLLVNNAGVMHVGPEQSMTDDDYRQAMDVIFWGTVNTTRAVLPSMRARREGRIANITSIGGKVPLPHMVPYAAAKFAAVGFSESMHAELRRYGVRVTTVVPGFMRTGSPVNAWVKGDARAEFAWFAAGGATPLTAMSADRAARRIVLAIRRGETELVLSWQAKLLRMAHALAPSLATGIAGAVNRALPKGISRERQRGMSVDAGFERNPLMKPMYAAARRNNEFAGTYSSSERDEAMT